MLVINELIIYIAVKKEKLLIISFAYTAKKIIRSSILGLLFWIFSILFPIFHNVSNFESFTSLHNLENERTYIRKNK